MSPYVNESTFADEKNLERSRERHVLSPGGDRARMRDIPLGPLRQVRELPRIAIGSAVKISHICVDFFLLPPRASTSRNVMDNNYRTRA